MDISQKMIIKEPLGVGLGAFTNHMQSYTDLKLAPWLYQPVHNIFLLMANEAGIIVGIMFIGIFIYLFYKIAPMTSKKKEASLYLCLFAYITIIGLFDHYFISLYSGQVMFFIVLGCMSQYIQQFRKEEKPSVHVKKPQ